MNYNIITYNGLADRQEMIKVFDLPDSVPLFVNDNNLFCLDDDDMLKKELSAVLKAPVINYKQLVFVPSKPLVSGIQTFKVLYSSKYDKLIILVGEQHTYSENKMCKDDHINASEFVKEMLKSTSKKQDVFVEDYYMAHITKKEERFVKHIPDNAGFMGRFVADNRSNNCMSNKKQDTIDCKEYGVKHVRFHRADIRTAQYADYTIIGYMNLFQYAEHLFKQVITKETDDQLKIVYDYIKLNFYRLNNIEIIKKELKDIINLSKIQKQLDRINDPLIIKEIMHILDPITNPSETCLNLLKQEDILKAFDTVLKTPNENIDQIQTDVKRIKDLSTCRIKMVDAVMDAYLLSRLFKTHINPDDTAKNVIIYTGSYHTDVYSDFLTSIGFTLMFNAPKLNILCVDVSGLKIRWL